MILSGGFPFPTMSRAAVSDEDRVANPIHNVKCEAMMPGRVLRTKLEPLATDIKHVKHERDAKNTNYANLSRSQNDKI